MSAPLAPQQFNKVTKSNPPQITSSPPQKSQQLWNGRTLSFSSIGSFFPSWVKHFRGIEPTPATQKKWDEQITRWEEEELKEEAQHED